MSAALLSRPGADCGARAAMPRHERRSGLRLGRSSDDSQRIGARRRAGEAGTAVVEFALIVPLLLLIVFGILDFGRALNYLNDSTQLARAGARWAIVNKPISELQKADGSPCTDSLAQCIKDNARHRRDARQHDRLRRLHGQRRPVGRRPGEGHRRRRLHLASVHRR